MRGDPAPVLAALDGYRNPDGGYSWGLEPDLRAGESQPGGAYHAFEVFAEIGPGTTPRAVELCDWLASVALPDGGLPFALPVSDPAGCAPFWAQADPTVSSLQISAFVTGTAQRVAAHDPAVAAHPWLAGRPTTAWPPSTRSTTRRSQSSWPPPSSSSTPCTASAPKPPRCSSAWAGTSRPTGRSASRAEREDEMMRALDFAPAPDRPVRELFSQEVVAAELQRLADEQQDDGGWPVDFDELLAGGRPRVARLHDRASRLDPARPTRPASRSPARRCPRRGRRSPCPRRS